MMSIEQSTCQGASTRIPYSASSNYRPLVQDLNIPEPSSNEIRAPLPQLPLTLPITSSNSYQLLVGDLQREGKTEHTVVLTAQTSKGRIRIICVNCKREGHLVMYCISPGGGMAGKTLEESKEVRRKDRESKGGKTTATPQPLLLLPVSKYLLKDLMVMPTIYLWIHLLLLPLLMFLIKHPKNLSASPPPLLSSLPAK